MPTVGKPNTSITWCMSADLKSVVEQYFARSLGFAQLTLGLVVVCLTGAVPLGSLADSECNSSALNNMYVPIVLTFKQPRRTPSLRSPMPLSCCPRCTTPPRVSTATLGSTRPTLEASCLVRWVLAFWQPLACGVSCSALVATSAKGQGRIRGPVGSHSKTGRLARGKARICRAIIWRPSGNHNCLIGSERL